MDERIAIRHHAQTLAGGRYARPATSCRFIWERLPVSFPDSATTVVACDNARTVALYLRGGPKRPAHRWHSFVHIATKEWDLGDRST
jgi:hypothetical protein